jgi:kinesin family protein 18/19
MGLLRQVSGPTGGSAGIVPRALDQIFQAIADRRDTGSTIDVSMNFVQLYNNTLQDLLQDEADAAPLVLREDKQMGIYVDGVKEFAVSSVDEARRSAPGCLLP